MTQNSSIYCPKSGERGQAVNNATVKSTLAVTLHRVQDVTHRFCPDPDCDVVYFAEDGSELFFAHELRERVYQKEPHVDDVLVCYCFFHTLGDIRNSVNNAGESPIVADIKTGIKQGKCACDWRNPQGNCCLGNVLKIVKTQQDAE